MKIFSASSHLFMPQAKVAEPSFQTTYNILDSGYIRSDKLVYPPIEVGEPLLACPVLVVQMSRLGKSIAKRFVHRYYDRVTVGFNLFVPKLYQELVQKELPLFPATSFDGAVSWGVPDIDKSVLQDKGLSVDIDGLSGDTQTYTLGGEYLQIADEIIHQISKYHTVKIGDVLLIPIVSEPFPIQIDRILCASTKMGSVENRYKKLTKITLK